jgi:hypothetical protein
MATKQFPIPQDKIGESFVWRDWLQKLSNRAFGTASTLDIPIQAIYGGTGQTSYNTGDILYSPSSNLLTRLPAPSATSFLQMTAAGVPSWNIRSYGSFHDTTTQTAAANTPTAITFNTTDYSTDVALGTPTSRVVISNAGTYNVQFSIQGSNSSAADDNITVWFRINGVDVTDSAGISAIPSKHGSISGALVFGWNQLLTFSANDYFEMYWTTDAGTSSLVTYAAGTSPVHPLSPSVAISITPI